MLVFSTITFYLLVPSVKAITTPRTYEAEADSYVSAGEPNDSYGASSYLHVGDYFYGTTESFFRFTIPDLADIESVVISIYMYSSVDSPLDLAICLIEDDWDEYTLTWNNKPSRGTELETLTYDRY